MSHQHITPDDPRLTAFVLGELDPAEAAAVETALTASPELQQAVAELRATTADLFAALQAEPVPAGGIELAASRTAAVTVAAPDATSPRRGRFLLVNAVTLLLLIGVIISLQGGPGQSGRDSGSRGLAKLSPDEELRIAERLAQLSLERSEWKSDYRMLNSQDHNSNLYSELEQVPELHAYESDWLRPQPQPRGVTLDEAVTQSQSKEKFLISEGLAGGTANQPVAGGQGSNLLTNRALQFSGAIPSTVASGTAGGNGAIGGFLPSAAEQSGGKPTSFRGTVRLEELAEQGPQPGGLQGGQRSEAERRSELRQRQRGGDQQRGTAPIQVELMLAEPQPHAGQSGDFGVTSNQPLDGYDALGVAGPHGGGQPRDISQSQNSAGGAGQPPTGAFQSYTVRPIINAFNPTTAGTPPGLPQNGQSQPGAPGTSPRSKAAIVPGATLYDYDNSVVAEDLVQYGVPATADPQQPQVYSFYTLKDPQAFFGWRAAQLSWDDGAWNKEELQLAKDQLARHWNFQPQQLAELEKLSEREVRELARGGRGELPWPAYLPYLGTEAYAPVDENEFTVPTGEQALSTFSLDVDTASYSNVRRFITEQQLPPPAAVRLEELVNYFDYELPQPQGDDPFSVTLEATSCPWNPKHRLVRIGLQGREIDMAKRPLTRLVFLLDVSGSMSDANKLPLVKDSMKLLVEQLGENDRIAIVTYSDTAELKLDSTAGSDKPAILAAIDSLSAGGSTNGAGGIQLAYETATKQFLKDASNRVILCTDGDFNVGVSSDDELVKMIEEKRQSGVFLSIFGYGMGNLKDAKLEGLADKGNGHYGYIDDLDEARKVFIEELTGMLYTIAKDVKLQVEFNPAKVAAYRLLGYENRTLAAEDFNNDAVDAGEMGAGHTVTALYEITPKSPWSPPVKESAPAVDALKYQQPAVSDQPSAEAGQSTPSTDAAPSIVNRQSTIDNPPDLLTVKLRYKQPTGDESVKREFSLADEPQKCSEDLQFAAAVTGFGMLLRNSQYGAGVNWDLVIELAEGAKGDDEQGHRGEFTDLARQARRLWQAAYPHGSPAEWHQRLTSLSVATPPALPATGDKPAAAMRSLVSEVSGKYAVVSLGSSHGVCDGQVFDVLRKSAQQQPPGAKVIEYLGQLRIIDVHAETSVGEFTPLKDGSMIATGDTVVYEL